MKSVICCSAVRIVHAVETHRNCSVPAYGLRSARQHSRSSPELDRAIWPPARNQCRIAKLAPTAEPVALVARAAKEAEVSLQNLPRDKPDRRACAPYWSLAMALISFGTAAATSDSRVGQVDEQGVLQLPPVKVPPSSFLSPEAKAKFIKNFSHTTTLPAKALTKPDPASVRQQDEEKNAPFVARARELWPVAIEPKVIGGVRTLVITP